jgi:transcriptional regulator with XRE-family HTH domain
MASGPTARRRQLGAELRRLRGSRTLEEAGKAAGVSRMTIARYEGKTGPVRWTVVDALCRFYGAPDDQREALVELAKTAKVVGWWKEYPDAIPDWITPLITLEDEAVEECHWAPTYVPGLLQTRAYAAAVIQSAEARAAAEDITRMVDVRMKRQDVLKRPTPLHVWAILDEAVIRRSVGGPAVMAEQLAHLHASAQAPTITVQVLPFSAGAHAAESNGFIILRGLEPDLDVVHLSNLSGALYLEKRADLERHRDVFNHLRSQALSAGESSEMIARAGDQFASAAPEES